MGAYGAREDACRIGRLLPQPIWGPYTLAIEQVLTRGRVA
jgi:hypothetical protein